MKEPTMCVLTLHNTSSGPIYKIKLTF